MLSVFSSISDTTKRLILLTAGAVLLMAAGTPDMNPQLDRIIGGPTISDDILAPVPAAQAAASAALLAATTPADVAAAARAAAAPTPVSFPEDETVTAPRPVQLTSLIDAVDDEAAVAVANNSDLRCLANAVYFESRGEPLEGQLAVAQAILNRVQSGRYASTVCGVVNQPKQFSFDRTRTPRAGNDWSTAQAIAQIASQDMYREVAPRAMSFHANYVSPGWQGKTRVAQIGRHIFYR